MSGICVSWKTGSWPVSIRRSQPSHPGHSNTVISIFVKLAATGACSRTVTSSSVPMPRDPLTGIHRYCVSNADSAPRQLVLVGHACHPTDSGNIQKWSPAYPGPCALSATRLPDTRALFVQGCGADAKVVHRDPESGQHGSSPRIRNGPGRRKSWARRCWPTCRKATMAALDSSLACTC
jgi:hypothetical protein